MDPVALSVQAERIKESVDVVEAAAWFGYDYAGRGPHPCPVCEGVSKTRRVLKLYFDDDRVRRTSWYCYHCKIGGDVIAWVAARLGVRNGHAIRALADRLGFSGDPGSILDWLRSELSLPSRRKLADESLQDAAAREVLRCLSRARARGPVSVGWLLYVDRLLGMARSPAAALRARAVHLAGLLEPKGEPPAARVTDDHLSLRAKADRYHRLLRDGCEPYWSYARRRGWLEDEVEGFRVGACPDPGTRFEGRAVFPVRDASGREVGFGGRLVVKDAGPAPGAKYLNSSESLVYRKGRTLYGLDLAAGAIARDGYAVLVEGYPDVLALRAAGIDPVVAPCGSALTHAQAESLALFAPRVVLMEDADAAGDDAGSRAERVLSGVRVRVHRAALPRGTDPDDLYRARGPTPLRRAVAEALAARRGEDRLGEAARSLRAG